MILLYNPRATEFKYRLPLSLLSLAAVFEGKYDWKIVDGNRDADAGQTLLDTLERDPSIKYLMVTVMPGPQLTRAVPHTRAVKARFPNMTVIWGGYFPSSHADVVLGDPAIDYAVRSQGEHTILELLDVLENGGSLASIDGLSYKENGSIKHNKTRKLADPNVFPDAALREKLTCRITSSEPSWATRPRSYHSSMGCPFTCSFCAVTKNYAGSWLAEKADRTVEHCTLAARSLRSERHRVPRQQLLHL